MIMRAIVSKQETHDMPEVHLDTRRLRCARFLEGETMLACLVLGRGVGVVTISMRVVEVSIC
jgi:hypothetical protein